MQILHIRPDRYTDGRSRTLALFDMALTDACRLYNIRLTETPNGQRRVYAPNAHGARAATFSPELAIKITAAASAAFEQLGSASANEFRAA